MEHAAASRIAHGDLVFYNPLSEADLDAAIALLDLEPGARVLVAPGGQVLLGEGYWRRPPSSEYLEALGDATADELAGYGGLLEAADTSGLIPLWSCVASERDWDRYEWTLVLNCERWAAQHAGDPAAEVLHARAAAARSRMALPAGRETLGFALLLLRRE